MKRREFIRLLGGAAAGAWASPASAQQRPRISILHSGFPRRAAIHLWFEALGTDIDLRLFMHQWKHAYALREPTEQGVRSSFQFFDASGKAVQRVHLNGHSHISETYAVGTADRTLSAPVLDFVRTVSAKSGT